MTGLDLSPASLAQARLAAEVGAEVDFVEAEVFDAVSVLGIGRFDFVFAGIGALCWLPSIRKWAAVVQALLLPGGRLSIREGHPMLWSLDDAERDSLVVDYPCFEPQSRRSMRPLESRARRDRHSAARHRDGHHEPR